MKLPKMINQKFYFYNASGFMHLVQTDDKGIWHYIYYTSGLHIPTIVHKTNGPYEIYPYCKENDPSTYGKRIKYD